MTNEWWRLSICRGLLRKKTCQPPHLSQIAFGMVDLQNFRFCCLILGERWSRVQVSGSGHYCPEALGLLSCNNPVCWSANLGETPFTTFFADREKSSVVGTALVAVFVKVRTGTSPVPTQKLLHKMTFSTSPYDSRQRRYQAKPFGMVELQTFIAETAMFTVSFVLYVV